jgi:hypothetical protein
MLGYGGHFLTKARHYSTTFGELRAARIAYRRHHEYPAMGGDGGQLITLGRLDDATPLVVGTLTFAGVGWRTTGDALLANTAAALARERRETGREELAHELGSTCNTVMIAA